MFDIVTIGDVACPFASFEDPTDASSVVQFINKQSAKFARLKKREVKTVAWAARELARFESGKYVDVPWARDPLFTDIGCFRSAARANTDYKHHYVHISSDDPSKIAHTPDNAYGEADRQVRMSPGRYLKKYYGDLLGNDVIKRLCSAFSDGYTFEILTQPHEISKAYMNGPSSCMSKPTGAYESPIHPTEVYGTAVGGDLDLAVLRDEDGDVVARCLVWQAKGIYGRVYGDEDRMYNHLEDYREDDFTGARVRAIPYNNTYVMPYIDWLDEARLDGDFFILGYSGLACQSTNGLAGGAVPCHDCGAYHSEDAMYWVGTVNALVCEACYDNYFTCALCGAVRHIDGCNTTDDGHTLCDYCYIHRSIDCSHCGSVFFYSDAIVGHTTDGEPLCESCAEKYHYDEDSEEYLDDDEWEEKNNQNEDEQEEAENA